MTLNAISHLGPSSLPVVVPSQTKGMQTEQLLWWSVMIDIEHSYTSGSNKVVVYVNIRYIKPNNYVLKA